MSLNLSSAAVVIALLTEFIGTIFITCINSNKYLQTLGMKNIKKFEESNTLFIPPKYVLYEVIDPHKDHY